MSKHREQQFLEYANYHVRTIWIAPRSVYECTNSISIPNEKDFHVTHVNGFILTSKWSQVDCRTDHPPAKR